MKTKSPLKESKLVPASGRGSPLQLKLEESELRYRRLFETAQDGILILDAATGKIIDANPFLLDLLDYPFESMIGLHLWEIGQFKDIAASREAFERLQTNEYIRYENLPLCSKGGKTIRVEFVSNAYFVGPHKVIQCNIRDISARNELGLSRDRIAQLESAGAQKDNVVAMLSHELRTPLTAISSMIDLVEMGHHVVGVIDKAEISPHFDKAAVTMIRRNVGSLVHLINELLDVTQIAKGTVEIELAVLDMHEAIRLLLKNYEAPRKAKLIAIDLRLDALQHYIQADEGKLQQILSNLVGNALKFTPKGGDVSIVSRNEGDNLLIQISDTGIGIAPEALGRIFSAFEQGDSSIHARFGGLGLGLSIAYNLVKAHGGTLQVHSEGPGHGATFTLQFKTQKPFFGEPFAPKSLGGRRDGAGAGARILLVEDNEDARRCLRGLLEGKGHKVQVAENCKAATELSDWHDFDILIADLGLPDGPGIDLLQEMRQAVPELQGIAISGFGMPEDLAATKAAGFAAHLVKPIDISKLAAAIESLPLLPTDGTALW